MDGTETPVMDGRRDQQAGERATFAMWLRELRARSGKTQKEAAFEAKLDEKTIERYENGRSTPRAVDLMNLLRVYGVAFGPGLAAQKTRPLAEEVASMRKTIAQLTREQKRRDEAGATQLGDALERLERVAAQLTRPVSPLEELLPPIQQAVDALRRGESLEPEVAQQVRRAAGEIETLLLVLRRLADRIQETLDNVDTGAEGP